MNEQKIINDRVYLNLPQFLFRNIVLIFIDILKYKVGQSIKRTLFNIIYYFIYLLSTNLINYEQLLYNFQFKIRFDIKSNFFFSIILILNISECVCWNFIQTPLNMQAVKAIDIKKIISDESDEKRCF